MINNIGFGRRNPEKDSHWEELDIKKYKIEKPILLCFGGNGVIDKAKATRFCATAERFMGLKPMETLEMYDFVDLLGFYYTKNPERQTIGEFTDEQRALIEDELFMQLCTDDKGNKLSQKETLHNFSLVNIFTHCWGAREVSRIGLNVERKMKKLGFTEDEILEAFEQVVHLTYAPYSDHTCFPSIRINSFIDSEHRGMRKLYKQAYGKDLNGIALHYDKAGYFRGERQPVSKVPICSIYSSQLVNTKENSNMRNILDEHPIEVLERNYDWTPGHQQRNGTNADVVSQMASYALLEVVAVSVRNRRREKREEKPTIKAIYEELKKMKEGFKQEDLETGLNY